MLPREISEHPTPIADALGRATRDAFFDEVNGAVCHPAFIAEFT